MSWWENDTAVRLLRPFAVVECMLSQPDRPHAVADGSERVLTLKPLLNVPQVVHMCLK